MSVLVLVAGVASPAFAQTADDVAAEVADTGVFVDDGLSTTPAEVGQFVSAVRSQGEELSIVLLRDEPIGGATTFADAVFNRLGSGVVLVIAETSDGWSGVLEEFGDVEFQDAIEFAAENATSDSEFLQLFVTTLTGVDSTITDEPTVPTSIAAETPEPEPVGAQSDSGGGGFGWLLWVVLIGGGVLLFMWFRRRTSTAAGTGRLSPEIIEAKAKAQEQINAVANDIIDMEDEVRVADNDQADEFYQAAGATYTAVVEAFPDANTPEAILGLANRLDQAIWQLDSAEAILDGKPLPQQPEPQRLPVPEPAGGPARPDRGVPRQGTPPRPDYSRRPTRRSSYGGGGSLINILIGMAGSMMANRSQMPRTVTPQQTRQVQNPRFPQVPTRSSPIPTPSNPSGGSGSIFGRSSSPSRSSSSSRRTRRGSTGRKRGGVSRRPRRRR